MKALVIVAHGSRNEASNTEVFVRVSEVTERLGKAFDIVETGFLELAKPGIEEIIEKCVQAGARRVDVLPFFLAAGRHVQSDIPEEIELLKNRHVDVEINLLNYLGAATDMTDFLCQHIHSEVALQKNC